MVTCIITIQETDKGIAIDQIPNNEQGTYLERKIAGVFDISLKLTQEYIAQQVGKGILIEGKNVESFIANKLKDMKAIDVRAEIRKAGYKV